MHSIDRTYRPLPSMDAAVPSPFDTVEANAQPSSVLPMVQVAMRVVDTLGNTVSEANLSALAEGPGKTHNPPCDPFGTRSVLSCVRAAGGQGMEALVGRQQREISRLRGLLRRLHEEDLAQQATAPEAAAGNPRTRVVRAAPGCACYPASARLLTVAPCCPQRTPPPPFSPSNARSRSVSPMPGGRGDVSPSPSPSPRKRSEVLAVWKAQEEAQRWKEEAGKQRKASACIRVPG